MTSFEALHLAPALVKAAHEGGYRSATPIQQQTIPQVLNGRDVLGCSQTGTAKTAAFALPILQRLLSAPPPTPRHVRALVISPTRELAAQIGESFATYGRYTGVRTTTVYEEVPVDPQIRSLQRGIDIVVGTPRRLLDLMQRGAVRFDRLEVLVLDEADRMLDMGSIYDVRRIVNSLPRRRQTLFFSATTSRDILTLARDMLSSPARVDMTPAAISVEKVDQSLYFVEKADKSALLAQCLKDRAIRSVLVFTRTKRGANRIVKNLNTGETRADLISSDKGPAARDRTLGNFRRRITRILVATDIAARGVSIEGVTHVINYDMPDVPLNYVHRIKRTARAGTSGAAITFCSSSERRTLAAIEKLIGRHIRVVAYNAAASRRGM